MLLFLPVSVGICLSCECFVIIEDLSPTPFFRLSHNALNYYWWSLLYITLFSALKQTHCTHVACGSEWVTASFFLFLLKRVFQYSTTRCTNSVIWFLYCWCRAKLLPSRYKFSVHHTTMHQFTVLLHSKMHRSGAWLFSYDLPPTLLAEWPGSFTCYSGNTGLERILK